MKQRIHILLIALLTCTHSAWAYVEEKYDYDGDGQQETYHVVYLKLGGATGKQDGSSRNDAVGSWSAAYGKLAKYTGTTDAERDAAWDRNVIVVCDRSNTGTLLIKEANTNGGIPATITGVWPWNNVKASDVINGGYVKLNGSTADPSTTRIGADTKLKYLNINTYGFISMYLHDLMFDVGCMMTGMGNMAASNGVMAGRTAPDIQVFLYANTFNFSTSTADGGWPAQKKPVTLTIKSGKFGRILSNRITGTTVDQVKQRYVIGNPSHPLMCKINIDIDPATSTGDWNPNKYNDDIAFLCAGMTQGSEYADVQFNIKRGKVATLVAAMQGMSIEKTKDAGLSNSSFFGRTITNIIPDDDADVTIQRYYAACLGRSQLGTNTSGMVNATFYGLSTLNMHGGRIESGAFVSAGGISGLKSEDGKYHTYDPYIPYVDATASTNYPYMGIKYQPYDASKTIAKVISNMYEKDEVIDLAKTVTAFNIYGGTINGGLYGGSYGYSAEMDVSVTMEGAGSLWGDTNVNIYGGTINGGIYGGGYGATDYYEKATAANKSKFLTVASVYGNTNVNIYGGNIGGNIYGGGAGVAATGTAGSATEFIDIAKVYGNTNVTIAPTDPDWTFTGNIYGGGALGSVDGNTNVTILGGNITGDVFGAGQGEEGYPNKAKVTGSTNVTIGQKN